MSLPLHRLFSGCLERVRDEKGFTLIELIVVTFLIGIMLSISIPSLRNTFFTDPLKASTRQIIGLVTGVREAAARSQQPYLLHISPMDNRIWYEKEVKEEENQENDTLQAAELLLPEAVKITEVLVSDDDGSSLDQIVIWISKQGFIADTIIRIEDNDGNHLNVRFYPFLDPAIVSDEVASF